MLFSLVHSYVYDTLNRLSTLTPPAAFTATGNFGFSYDALCRRTQMTRPNSATTNYAYDNLSRLQSVLHQLAGSTIDGGWSQLHGGQCGKSHREDGSKGRGDVELCLRCNL
ncbi:MAG TPA: hypothetical protein VGI16_12155 [Candidatus Acidoferrum sp.]